MADKKQRVNIYSLAHESGTAALEAFLAGEPRPSDIGHLLQSYTQKEEKEDRVKAVRLLLARPELDEFNLNVSLGYACERGYTETVSLLLEHPKVNVNDSGHGTPLSTAILRRHSDCALLLLKAGADPDLVPKDWPSFTEDVPAKKDGPSPLLNAIRTGDVKMVEALIKAKADVNQKTKLHRRPLDVALELSQNQIVEVLKKAGAKVISPEELTLEQAVSLGYLERMEQLLDKAELDEAARDRIGLLAADAGKLAVIEILWRRGLSQKEKYSLFNNVICYNHWELVTPLLKLGAPPSNPEKKPDQSPLLLAAIGQKWDVILELLAAGADPRLDRGVTKETALICTVRRNRADIVEALLKAGADPNIKTQYKDTPLGEARKNGNQEIIKLLEASAEKPKAKTPRKTTKKEK